MKTIFHPEAEEEFIAAVRQYSDIDLSLGADFEAKVEEGVLLAMTFPSMWREISPGLHRILIRRFPYGIIYAYDEDVFYILAVMHLHARPGYWKERMKDSPVRPRRTGRKSVKRQRHH